MSGRIHVLMTAVLLAFGVGLLGCASSGGGASGERLDVLTAEQMAEVEATNLYDIIQRLRPQWLRVRDVGANQGRSILVVRGGTVLGGVEVLRNTGAEGILELRHRDGDTEGARLVGSRDGFVESVIEIVR